MMQIGSLSVLSIHGHRRQSFKESFHISHLCALPLYWKQCLVCVMYHRNIFTFFHWIIHLNLIYKGTDAMQTFTEGRDPGAWYNVCRPHPAITGRLASHTESISNQRAAWKPATLPLRTHYFMKEQGNGTSTSIHSRSDSNGGLPSIPLQDDTRIWKIGPSDTAFLCTVAGSSPALSHLTSTSPVYFCVRCNMREHTAHRP